MTPAESAELTKFFEGYRGTIYKDSLGNPTGGWGTHLFVGRRVPVEIWKALFDADYSGAEAEYESLGFELDPVRRCVVVDMLYNMGIHKFLKLVSLVDALRDRDYERAAGRMEKFLWFRQVGRRGPILVRMMRTGEPPVCSKA